jgi:murein peptide amidase A
MTPAELLAAIAGWPEIGRSVEGRPIAARSFAGGEGEPVLLFGAIHGEEPLGAACLVRLAEELRPPLPRPAWLVPVVNPDGYLVDRRHNARGVDLNRNFPASNWSREHKPGYEPGEQPASEPETRVLMDLIVRSGARRLIALHSPFRTVNYDGPARELAERMAAANGYGASADIGYPTPGSFGSYYALDLGLEVITLEIPPMDEEQAWRENRAALYIALDMECDSLSHSPR